jgi:hypothetical protein
LLGGLGTSSRRHLPHLRSVLGSRAQGARASSMSSLLRGVSRRPGLAAWASSYERPRSCAGCGCSEARSLAGSFVPTLAYERSNPAFLLGKTPPVLGTRELRRASGTQNGPRPRESLWWAGTAPRPFAHESAANPARRPQQFRAGCAEVLRVLVAVSTWVWSSRRLAHQTVRHDP